MCNGWQHFDDCSCPFGGGNGGDRWARTVVVEPPPTSWARWSTGHARSDLGEPCTHPTTCPVCGAEIIFHTNGNGDVVFFDEPLGPPWEKHPCLAHEGGVRRASRSEAMRSLARMVARPSVIPIPNGLSPAEFDPSLADRAVYGVIVRMKAVTVWWARAGGSAVRSRLDAVALSLYVGTRRAVRVYAPRASKVRVGDVVKVSFAVRQLDGRDALWAVALPAVDPDKHDAPLGGCVH